MAISNPSVVAAGSTVTACPMREVADQLAGSITGAFGCPTPSPVPMPPSPVPLPVPSPVPWPGPGVSDGPSPVPVPGSVPSPPSAGVKTGMPEDGSVATSPSLMRPAATSCSSSEPCMFVVAVRSSMMGLAIASTSFWPVARPCSRSPIHAAPAPPTIVPAGKSAFAPSALMPPALPDLAASQMPPPSAAASPPMPIHFMSPLASGWAPCWASWLPPTPLIGCWPSAGC